MNGVKLSAHFNLSEFDFIEPESSLLFILEHIRNSFNNQVIITSGPRSIQKHIEIYKALEADGLLGNKKWIDCIPWGSRHLPEFGKKLRAVDIKVVKERDSSKSVTKYHSGDDILSCIKDYTKCSDIYFGVGVGKEYCHIDCDRQKETVWYYNY